MIKQLTYLFLWDWENKTESQYLTEAFEFSVAYLQKSLQNQTDKKCSQCYTPLAWLSWLSLWQHNAVKEDFCCPWSIPFISFICIQ